MRKDRFPYLRNARVHRSAFLLAKTTETLIIANLTQFRRIMSKIRRVLGFPPIFCIVYCVNVPFCRSMIRPPDLCDFRAGN